MAEINTLMKKIIIAGNKVTITAYNSSSGTLPDIEIQPIFISNMNKADLYPTYETRLRDITSLDREIEAINLFNKYNKISMCLVKANEIDTNSTSYDADMKTYYDSLSNLIIS